MSPGVADRPTAVPPSQAPPGLLASGQAGSTRGAAVDARRDGEGQLVLITGGSVEAPPDDVAATTALPATKTRRPGPPRTGPRPSLTERLQFFLEREGNKRLGRVGVALYRLTRGRFVEWLMRRKVDVLLLTTRGRRSGRERTVLLQFFRDGGDLVVVAVNSGQPTRNPDWYHNLKASPLVRVEVMDRNFRARAEDLSAERAAAFWPRVLDVAPGYARWSRLANRTIPLLRLVPLEPTR
jgi:deazaflavin-dependent oxidoreductase (nitroreductase family)